MGPAWRLQHPQSRALLWHVVSALHALLIPVCRCSMTQTACTAEPCSCLACDECPSASQSTCMPMHHCKGSLYNRACCLCSMLVLLSACIYALHLIKVPWCAGSKAVMSVIALHHFQIGLHAPSKLPVHSPAELHLSHMECFMQKLRCQLLPPLCTKGYQSGTCAPVISMRCQTSIPAIITAARDSQKLRVTAGCQHRPVWWSCWKMRACLLCPSP